MPIKTEYTASAVINAAPEKVWSILTDAVCYGAWNPEIVGVEGRMALGERIKARVKVGGQGNTIRSVPMRITEFEPPRRMIWIGGLPLGLFVGRRTFTIRGVQDASSGAAGEAGHAPAGHRRTTQATEFRMDLHMSGPLAKLILKSVGDRQPDIDQFTAGLKHRAESM